MIARHLRGSGFEVTGVESAEEVILRAGDTPRTYDVVISDVHLPGTSGLDLASYLLKHSPTQPIPSSGTTGPNIPGVPSAGARDRNSISASRMRGSAANS